ncbi:MAG: hypothetical protein RBU21_13840 [FCB group bacterium]|jgi:hypothetical protein|nr:hypothetical protein [FCB group bacterium]
MRTPSIAFAISLAGLLLCLPALGQPAVPETQFMPDDPQIQKLQQELRALLQRPPQESKPGKDIDRKAHGIAAEIRNRVLARLLEAIERNLGPMQPIAWDTVPLEAVDAEGRVIEIPMNIPMRPLRKISDAAFTTKTNFVMGNDNLALTLYDTLPQAVAPEERTVFERAYTGDDARAVETEAQVLVSLKGGEWAESATGPVANAIAVRGLDLDHGLRPNGNTTYDDTLYLVIAEPGKNVEAYEYRMTTESSSTQRGVGRLDSKQVWYVRGKHRGKDPAYKLKGSVAEGTRAGLEGTHQIVGANIHSAYSKRSIDSETPLRPNVSLGCQVIAAGKTDFEKSMVKLLDAKGITEFPYTIVEGEELSVLDAALEQHQRKSILIHGVPRPKAPGS